MNVVRMKTKYFAALIVVGCALSNMARAEVVVVLNSGEGTVSLIDKATMVETQRIPVG